VLIVVPLPVLLLQMVLPDMLLKSDPFGELCITVLTLVDSLDGIMRFVGIVTAVGARFCGDLHASSTFRTFLEPALPAVHCPHIEDRAEEWNKTQSDKNDTFHPIQPFPVIERIIDNHQRYDNVQKSYQRRAIRHTTMYYLRHLSYKTVRQAGVLNQSIPMEWHMDIPQLTVNFKTYEQASGENARKLAYSCEKIAEQTGANIAIAVQNADIGRIAPRVDIPVFAQHADPVGYGSNTGHDILPTLKNNGASGVIINHSEYESPLEDIEDIIKRCKKHSVASLVCFDDRSLGKKVAAKDPDFIAYEPPELVGGTTSVTDAKPELLQSITKTLGRKTAVLTGAGIRSSGDVERALELGSKGVLVASGVIKADDPEQALKELVSPF